jgi:hypothetical protein
MIIEHEHDQIRLRHALIPAITDHRALNLILATDKLKPAPTRLESLSTGEDLEAEKTGSILIARAVIKPTYHHVGIYPTFKST